jgi:hypothetical protein
MEEINLKLWRKKFDSLLTEERDRRVAAKETLDAAEIFKAALQRIPAREQKYVAQLMLTAYGMGEATTKVLEVVKKPEDEEGSPPGVQGVFDGFDRWEGWLATKRLPLEGKHESKFRKQDRRNHLMYCRYEIKQIEKQKDRKAARLEVKIVEYEEYDELTDQLGDHPNEDLKRMKRELLKEAAAGHK